MKYLPVHKTSRRCFLHTTAAVGLTVGCAGAGNGVDPEPFGTVSAGSVASLPVGALQAIPGVPAYIGRDAGGLYAMTSTCSHAGCDMTVDGDVSSSGIYCACHGSRFDANGGVVVGPASAPLAHFAVSVDGSGNISVDGGKQVDASARTKVKV